MKLIVDSGNSGFIMDKIEHFPEEYTKQRRVDGKCLTTKGWNRT